MKLIPAVLLVLACSSPLAAAALDDGLRTGGAEVQISICSEPGLVISSLKLKRQGTKSGEVWLFDTAGLDLFRQGVRLRLRVTGRKSELTLKARNQDCSRVNPALLPADQSKCEYDQHGTHSVGAVSISRILDENQVRALLEERTTLVELLSPAQVRFLQEGVALWPLPPALKQLGPVKLDTYHRNGKPYTVQISQLPSGQRYLEISQKSSLEEASRVHAELEALLSRKQLKLCPDQGPQVGGRLHELLGH
jgi:hypothetical protein